MFDRRALGQWPTTRDPAVVDVHSERYGCRTHVQIEMDFVDDIAVGLTADLTQLGYVVPAASGTPLAAAHKICVQHWNAYARRIHEQQRVVHCSTELQRHELTLPEAIRRGLAKVIEEIEAGADLTPRLSRKLPNLRYKDGMLNDWGFHHLHLDEIDPPRGTAQILILMVRPDGAYLIDVREHEHWADQDLVEIVHTNWPATIAQHRQLKALGLVHKLTDEQHATLRSKGGNAPIQTSDGAVYMALGGGMAGSRDNIRAVLWGDWLLAEARNVEEFFDGQREWLCGMIERHLGTRPTRIRVHLVNINRQRALLCFDYGGRDYYFEQPIVEPPRTVIDLTGDTLAQ